MWATPNRASRVLLCLHGGGFISGSIYSHRKMFDQLAKATGAWARIINCHLASHHTHPTQADR